MNRLCSYRASLNAYILLCEQWMPCEALLQGCVYEVLRGSLRTVITTFSVQAGVGEGFYLWLPVTLCGHTFLVACIMNFVGSQQLCVYVSFDLISTSLDILALEILVLDILALDIRHSGNFLHVDVRCHILTFSVKSQPIQPHIFAWFKPFE